MATLATNKPRVYEWTGPHPEYNEHPVIAADIIYAGAAVSLDNSGNAQPLVVANTENGFAGFAGAQVDNSTGAAGARRVNLFARGYVKLAVTGVSSNDFVNDAVYATDDDTFTLTGTGGLQIGKVSRWISGTTCMVYFEAANLRSI
jgi:hypothetical protein